MHPLPCTPLACDKPERESTHRTNGDPRRSPGGRTAALSDLSRTPRISLRFKFPSRARPHTTPYDSLRSLRLPFYAPHPLRSHQRLRDRRLRMTPRGRVTFRRQSFSTAPSGTSPRSTYATRRSIASAPTPRCPPSAHACCPSRNAGRTTGSRHCPAATQPQPGQLHDQAPHVLVARLADPLLPLRLTARCTASASSPPATPVPCRSGLTPREQLRHQDPALRTPTALRPINRRTCSNTAPSPRAAAAPVLAESRTCRCSTSHTANSCKIRCCNPAGTA